MLAEFKFAFDTSLVCAAIHNGHELSETVRQNLAVSEATQLYEEDPYTENFTRICNNTIIAKTSRFEVDLNRNLENCVYLQPNDAWGLKVRKQYPSANVISESREKYLEFYRTSEEYLRKLEKKFGNFFVWDIHSYNHHRKGPNENFDDPVDNPDIMLGLSNMHPKWLGLIRNIKTQIENYDYFGRKLSVTTQGKFPGGNFSRWIHNTFPRSGCCVAIEFKKIFMDEWTGILYKDKQDKLIEMLRSLSDLILSELPRI